MPRQIRQFIKMPRLHSVFDLLFRELSFSLMPEALFLAIGLPRLLSQALPRQCRLGFQKLVHFRSPFSSCCWSSTEAASQTPPSHFARSNNFQICSAASHFRLINSPDPYLLASRSCSLHLDKLQCHQVRRLWVVLGMRARVSFRPILVSNLLSAADALSGPPSRPYRGKTTSVSLLPAILIRRASIDLLSTTGTVRTD